MLHFLKYMQHLSTVCLLLLPFSIHATLVVRGNATTQQTFSVPIAAKVFDQATGTLYVGLSSPPASPNESLMIAKVGRNSTTLSPKFTGIGSGITATNGIEFLTRAADEGDTTPLLAGVTTIGNTTGERTRIFVTYHDGSQVVESSNLLDASGAINTNGATTAGIKGLAANDEYVFVAVKPNGDVFGAANSGIAVVAINHNATSCPETIESLAQTKAVAGDDGIKAKTLDPTTPEIQIQNDPTISDFVTMHWDNKLERLYTGLQLATGAVAGDGAKSIIVGRVDNDILTYANIAPDAAFTTAMTNIVGVTTAGATQNLAIHHIRTLHTSTGPSYLIVNGGNGDSMTTNDQIYALPLVNNPTSPATHGTLADKNSALTNFVFTVPAAANADLPTNIDTFALVGRGLLPIAPATPISDIVAIGDTVYVSVSIQQDDTNETGVFYSQALFDATGKILRWTPWAKRAFPFDGIPTNLLGGRITFFDVDAVTGNIWAIGDDTTQTVAVTEWNKGASTTSLTTQLNTVLPGGSYSALDLDAYTQNFNGNTAHRYALFGGVRTVAFARTSESRNGTVSLAPQTVTTDFSTPDNFLLTYLPQGAGCVTSLAYSRSTAQNIFFAGTATGLYEFGNNFNVNTLSTLDMPPFSTGLWTKNSDILGSVVDIKSSGNAAYVVTTATSLSQPLVSRLYYIIPGSTAVLIAQSGTAPFTSRPLFTGIGIISTSDTATEQVVLATNKGLLRTSRAGGIQQAGSTQANALWIDTDLNPGDTTLYNGIASVDTPTPIHTIWPWSTQDPQECGFLNRGSIHQVNGSDAGFAFAPEQFNGDAGTPNFETLFPIQKFFSDGTRRFFIVQRPVDPPSITRLMVLPFNTTRWNITCPDEHILFDQALSRVQAFYWVKQIGATGILLAGTETGVIALS